MNNLNACNFYLFLIILIGLNGVIYEGGGLVSQVTQTFLFLISFYYVYRVNRDNKNKPIYVKSLNVLLLLFTAYGFLLIISGQVHTIGSGMRVVSNTYYLKLIFLSLLPIYAFFFFAKTGDLTEKKLRVMSVIFLVLAIMSFFRMEESLVLAAEQIGSTREEFTNNMGYAFVGLLPALVVFYRKPVIQYLILAVCSYFIIQGMKRGAILTGAVTIVWFMYKNLQGATRKRKIQIVLITIAVIIAGYFFIDSLLATSEYFNQRIAQTEEGDSSGRDEIFAYFLNFFLNETDFIGFIFGNGADATLTVSDNYAHNDWLEIAINQGVLGLIIYIVYWIRFYRNWKKSKSNRLAYTALGMILLIYFTESFYSMSYNAMTRCSTMLLGYFLALVQKSEYKIHKT